MKLSPVVEALIEIFEQERISLREGYKYTVSRTVSTLAVLYEKARNAVEFRAEHLVRRAAIQRILKRRIMLDSNPQAIAETLTLELLWAKYIDSSLLDEKKIREIADAIERYLHLKLILNSYPMRQSGISWETMMGIASSEIDEMIVSPKKRQALINFVYQAIRPKVHIPNLDEKQINMQTYIAVERAFAQADDALVAFHLLKVITPDWFIAVKPLTDHDHVLYIKNTSFLATNLIHPINRQLSRYIRERLPPFRLLRDLFLEKDVSIRQLIDDPVQLEEALVASASQRYREIGAKIRRGVVRSIIYIFLTKMVFALALEAPFDMLISKHLDYTPLLINLLFPPILLYLVAGFTSPPGSDNTKRLIGRIRTILYHFDDLKHESDIFMAKTHVRRPILNALFTLFYLAAFLITFGFIAYVLTRLHFNIASKIIFVFFIALVSIFAYRIRNSAKEYEIVEHQGFLEPLIDFFFIPILQAGDFLSKEIAKINIFIFLFDFILEAPLKVIFEVVEEWIRFIRMKKEEIV